MKTEKLTLKMLTGLACLIFSTASLAQTDEYQKVQKSVFDPVMSQEKGRTPGLWTGAVSADWHNPLNWSDGVVPASTVDVVIPAPPSNQPVINTAHANCKSLIIHPFASLTIGAYYLTIQNDLTVHGSLNKNSASGLIRVYGNVVWESGSTAGFSENSIFQVYGEWNFNEGANVNFANGAVDFMGTGDSWIRCYSDNCSFNNLRIYKSLANAKVSNLSTDDLVINGLTFVDTHATFESFSSENILMGGDFIYYGSFDFTMLNNDGSVIFNGISQTIDNYGSGSGTFGHVVFNSSMGTFVADGDFNVARSLTIEQGYFNAGSSTITVGGNWTNNVGSGGFISTSSTIIFESSGDHQDVTGTNVFYNVTQLNAGNYLRFQSPTTIQNNLALNYLCWAYQSMNISGMLDLSNVGSMFTANTANANVTISLLNQGGKLMANGGGSIFVNNLVQNYVGGIIEAGTGSLIDITNSDPGEFVDLKGSLYNYGGTINLSGSLCYWPFAHGAHLEMSDGIIDIKTCGLTIYHLYNWTHNITGGTIRTSGGFSGNRADFTPTAGTFEFYGSSDKLINQSNGCTLYDVVINKSAKGGGENFTSEPVYDERSGKQLSGGGKANTILLGSDFTITGNLDIDAGTLSIGQYAFNIFGNTNISGNLDMTHDLSVINAQGDVFWNSGSTANFTAENVFIAWGHWNFENGSNANFADGTILFKGNTSKYIRSHSQTSSFNNVDSDKTVGAEVGISSNSTTPLTINGNIYVNPEAVFGIYSIYDVILKGNINSNGTFLCDHGRVVLNGTNQSLKMNTGDYFNNLAFNQSGTLTIDNSLSDIIDVKGNVEIQSGVFSLQDREMYVGNNWTNNAGSEAFSEGTSLVVFNGSGELNHQLINGTTNFYNVSNTKTGGGTLYFMGVTNIANNFIANGVNVIAGPAMSVAGLLDLSTGSLALSSVAPTVTVNNFTMGGDFSVIDGNFACTDITNDGIYGNIDLSNGIISLNQVGEQYTDLNGNLNISGGTFNVNGTFDLSILGWSGPASLTMSGGVLNFNTPGIGIVSAHTIATSISGGIIRTPGSFQVSHPNFTPTGGTAELYGNNPVYVQSSGGAHFYNLTIDKPAGSLLGRNLNKEEEQIDAIREQRSQKGRMVCEPPSGRSDNSAYTNGNLKVANSTVIEAGSLIIEYDASISGHFTVNESGKLSLLNLGSLAMGDSKMLTVNSGGELSLQGNAIDFPKITHISGNYGLNIESAATIGAEYAIFEYMNTAGVNVKPGAHVDPAQSFTNCLFRNGQSGGRLLTLNNNQTLLMNNVSFPGSSGNFNISKTVDEGVVVLTDYSGGFAGATWEQDVHNRIHWTGEPSTDIVLDGAVVGSYEDFCFEAIENITVGGSQNFVVEAFGAVNLVAGESILMLPGTHAQSGSYLYAQISDVSFCSGLPLALVAAMSEEPDQHNWQEMNKVKTNKGFIKVFPNPTRDIITLELASPAEDGLVVIEVYNLMGQNLMSKKMEAKPLYQLDLTGLQNEVYLLKVTDGITTDFARLIKQ